MCLIVRCRLWKKLFKNPPHDLKDRLAQFESVILDTVWKTPEEVVVTFPRAEMVDNKVVVNCGSKYRITIQIDYEHGIVYVRDVMHHDEYDKGKWKHTK